MAAMEGLGSWVLGEPQGADGQEGSVNPLAIWFLLQLGHSREAPAMKGAAVPFSAKGLAREWTRAELAKRGVLTATVEVTGYDDLAAQIRINLRLKAQIKEQWHFNDSYAHQELREFMQRNSQGQPWQIGR